MDEHVHPERSIHVTPSLPTAALALVLIASLAPACGGKTSVAPTPPTNVAPGLIDGPDHSIRDVDWRNRTYDLGDEGSFTVTNGDLDFVYDAQGNKMSADEFARRYPALEPDARGYFTATPPVFADVDGDTADEAIVTTTLNTGGTGRFSTIWVFRMDHGSPVALGTIPGGDRADGGIDGVTAEADGTVVVDRYVGGEGACCPTATVRERWRWRAGDFVEDEARRGAPVPIDE